MTCLDKRVLAGLGMITIGLFAVWPSVALVVAPFRGNGGASCGSDEAAGEGVQTRAGQVAELRAEIHRLRSRQRDQEDFATTTR